MTQHAGRCSSHHKNVASSQDEDFLSYLAAIIEHPYHDFEQRAKAILDWALKSHTDELLRTISVLCMLSASMGHDQTASSLFAMIETASKELGKYSLALSQQIDYMKSICRKGGPDVSVHILKASLGELQQSFRDTSSTFLVASYNLGWALLQAKQWKEAEAQFGMICREHGTTSSPDIMLWAMIHGTQARALYHLEFVRDAEKTIHNVIDTMQKSFDPTHPVTLEYQKRQAMFLRKLGESDTAKEIEAFVLSSRLSLLGPHNCRTKSSMLQSNDQK